MSDSVRPHRRQPTRVPRPWDSPGKNTGVGCHFFLQCMKVKSESAVAQSCPTLATPWTAAHQALPSMGFSRQKYWSGVPLPSPTISMRKVNTDSSSNVVYHLNLICKQTQLSIDRSPPSDQVPESLTSSPFREPIL